MSVRVVVVVLVTKLIAQFSLKSVEKPSLGNHPCWGQSRYVVLVPIIVGMSKQSRPYVWVCWKCCIFWCCDSCPSVDTSPCVWVSYQLWWLVINWYLLKLRCLRKGGILVDWGLHCELNVGVKGIKVDKELLGMFCLVDNKSVIYVPKPNPGGLGRCLRL